MAKLTAAQRKDWRNLPYDDWNTATTHAYFADTNNDLFGAAEYFPMRNWGFEQGAIKRALADHGAEILHAAFDECFRTYTPTRDYPILTAGFCLSYRVNGIIPKLKAEQAEAEQAEAQRLVAEKERVEMGSTDYDAMKAWL